MYIGSRQKLHTEGDTEIQTYIDSKPVKKVDHTKSLGLIIDNRLSWGVHKNEYICKNVASAIGTLKRMTPCKSFKNRLNR